MILLEEEKEEEDGIELILTKTEERMDKTIKLLMEISDMGTELLKGMRCTYVHIPYGVYMTEWGQSLTSYLSDASSLFTTRLKKMITLSTMSPVRFDQHSRGKTLNMKYLFNGIQYETHATNTMEITISRDL